MLIKRLIVLIVLLSGVNLYGQLQGQALLDSLEDRVPHLKNDTNAVVHLASLSFKIAFSDPSKGIKYGYQALNRAEKLKWKAGIGQSLNSLGVNHSISGRNEEAMKFFERALKEFQDIKDNAGEAQSLGNISLIYWNQGKYAEALDYTESALELSRSTNDSGGIARNLTNMGLLYSNLGQYLKASESFYRALKINEKRGDKQEVANNYNNLGLIKYYQKKYDLALSDFKKSLEINEKLENKQMIALNLANIGQMYSSLKQYDNAMVYYNKSNSIYKEIGNEQASAGNFINLADLKNNIGDYEAAILLARRALALLDQEGGKRQLVFANFSIAESYSLMAFGEGDIVVDSRRLDSALIYSLKAEELATEIDLREETYDIYNLTYRIYKSKGKFELALEYFEKYTTLKDSVLSKDVQTQIANLEAIKENEVKDKKLEIKNLEIERNNSQKLALAAAILSLGFIVFLVIRQRQKSEKLLLNILPKKIADRLKTKEYPIADYFENSTVVFIDIVGFTNYSKDKRPQEVVQQLNGIFTQFDMIADRFGLEKIKTIGDGYMAVSGIPEIKENNCIMAAKFAIYCKESIHTYNAKNGSNFNVRIGLESGPVVAGVIGNKKFIYDLWGDTVNTASRMESYGKVDRIHVTENFKNSLLKSRFKDEEARSWEFEELPPLEIKGKGVMQTYLLKA